MTNKLPVVGKRYRYKDIHKQRECSPIKIDAVGKLYVVAENAKLEDRDILTREENVCYVPTRVFFDIFEELPEDKAETKPVGKVSGWDNGSCPAAHHPDTYRDHGKPEFKCPFCGDSGMPAETKPETQIKMSDNVKETFKHLAKLVLEKPETQSSELSPEVKEAMEELEDYFCRSLIDSNDIIAAMQHYRELKDKTKNLLNALDKQFNQPSESGDVKEEEVSKNDKVANQTLQEKEESIWKPVSELPELAEGDTMDCFIRSDKGDVAKSCFYKREDEIGHAPCGFEEKEEKEYCSLTDFINDYEKLKERVRKLEETKLNK